MKKNISNKFTSDTVSKVTYSFISNISSITTSILKTTLFIAIAFGICGTFGVQKTEAAATNYFVDLTGNGCGNNCSGFQSFLASNGISTTSSTGGNASNTNINNGNQGTSTRASSTASPYPYQTYTNFASTDSFYKKVADYNKNYQNQPDRIYSYYQDPSSKYDSALVGQYPESYYVYYGSDASTQMNKYAKTYKSVGTSSGTGYQGYGANSGFTITAIK